MTPLNIEAVLELGNFSLQISEQLPVDGVLGVLGGNGAGKTSLLRLLAGLEHPQSGRLEVDGVCWFDSERGIALPTHERRVGMVFQDARLFPHLSVAGNLDFAARRARGPAVPREQVLATLGLGPLLNRRPAALSGGERQRVALARALMSAPKLLLLDEPLSAADMGYRGELLSYLHEVIGSFGLPTVYVAHTLDEMTRLARHLLVMRGGKCVANGRITEVLAQLDLPEVSQGHQSGAVIEATVAAHDATYQLTHLTFGDQQLSVTGLMGTPGDQLRIRIYATDVAIATRRPEAISIRNVLTATVDGIRVDAQLPYADVLLTSGGHPIRTRLTRASLDELGLAEGQSVFALLKAASLVSD